VSLFFLSVLRENLFGLICYPVIFLTKPSLQKLTGVFFRVGNTTFGGGYVTMAVLGRELVDLRRWITAEDYALAFAVARVTPGTNIIAFCAAVGWLVLRWAGALAAVVALTAPTAVLAVFILRLLESGASHPFLMAAIAATVAAVSGMMWSIVWTLVSPHLKGFEKSARAVIIAGGSFLASWIFNITPVPILAVAALIGVLWKDRASA
jgi:chromate transporter